MGVQYVDIDVPHGVAEAVAKVDGVALASLIDEGRFVGGGQAWRAR